MPRSGVRAQGWIAPDASTALPVTLCEAEVRREGDGYVFEFSNLPEGPVMVDVASVASRARIDLRKNREDVELMMDERWLWLAGERPEAEPAQAEKSGSVAVEARTVELVFEAEDGGSVREGSLPIALKPPGGALKPYEARSIQGGRIELKGLAPGTRVLVCDADIPGYAVLYEEFEVEKGSGVQRKVIRALAAGAIRVELKDEQDAPLFGAQVTLTGEARPGEGPYFDPGLGFQKNERGAFGPLPIGGTYQVTARHSGREVRSEPITLTAARPIADVALRFYPAKAVRVRVEGPGGATVTRMKVGVGRQYPGVTGWGLENFQTDEAGEFRLEGARRSGDASCTLHVAFERDWQPLSASFTGDEPEPWVLTVKPGLRLTGRVVRVDGSPVAGVRPMATWEGWSLDPKRPRSSFDAEGKTDAEGRFRFSNLSPGTLRFMVAGHPAPHGMRPPSLELPVAEDGELLITVE